MTDIECLGAKICGLNSRSELILDGLNIGTVHTFLADSLVCGAYRHSRKLAVCVHSLMNCIPYDTPM